MLLIKVLLGSKRQACIFWDIYILVILVSKQFATFLLISSKSNIDEHVYGWRCTLHPYIWEALLGIPHVHGYTVKGLRSHHVHVHHVL